MPKSSKDENNDLERNESTPLVKNKHKSTTEKWQKWWEKDVTKEFKVALGQAFRVAIWASLIAAVPLSFPRGRAKMASYGINVAKVVCTFLLVVSSTVGGSVAKGIYTLVGNLVSAAHITTLYYFFPYGGHLADNDGKSGPFWIGATSAMLYMIMFLWLNIPAQMQLFALMTHMYYMMKFLGPADVDAFDIGDASPGNSILLCLAAVIFAILSPLLPFPETSKGQVHKAMRGISQDMIKLNRALVLYYSGAVRSLEIKLMQGELRIIKKRISSVGMADSWFECFGYGAAGRSRFFTAKLLDLFGHLLRRWDPLIEAICNEEFDDIHEQVMNPEIRQLLSKTMDDFEMITDALTTSAEDGDFDEKEKAEIRAHIVTLQGTIIELSRVWDKNRNEVSEDPIVENLSQETIFFQTICMTCRCMTECAEQLMAMDHSQSATTTTVGAVFGIVFDKSKLFNKDHLVWVLRQATSITLAFLIGFVGYSPGCAKLSKGHRASCYIFPYDANVAVIVVILMSKFVGSVFKKGLDRLTAMVIANFAALTGHVFVGWCSLSGRIFTGMAVFLLVLPAKYVSFSGGSFVLLGTRVAAIGAAGLLIPCSDELLTDSRYGKAYNKVISTIVGVTIMLFVDLVFAGGPPSQVIKDTLYKEMGMYKELVHKYLAGEIRSAEFIEKIANLRKMLEGAQALVDEAKQEPRFYRPPWRQQLNQEALDGFLHLCNISNNLAHAMQGSLHSGKDAPFSPRQASGIFPILEVCPAFHKVRKELNDTLDFTVEIAGFVLSKKPRKDVPKRLVQAGHHARFKECLDELVKELNVKIKEKRNEGKSEGLARGLTQMISDESEKTAENKFNTLATVIVELLDSLSFELHEIRHNIFHNKIPL